MLWAAASRSTGGRFDPPWLIVVGDLIVITIGVAITGGAESSSIAVVFFVWTIAMSLLFPPRMVVLVCARA